MAGTPSKVVVTGGNITSYSITEGGQDREIQRMALNDALGADVVGLLSDAAWSGSGTPGGMLALVKAMAAALITLETPDTLDGVADSGSSPAKIGGVAYTDQNTMALLAAGARAQLATTRDRALLVRQFAHGDLFQDHVTLAAGTLTGTLQAVVTGRRFYLTNLSVHNRGTVAARLDLKESVTGNVLWSVGVPANDEPLNIHWGATGLQFGLNNAINLVLDRTTNGVVTISGNGYKSEL